MKRILIAITALFSTIYMWGAKGNSTPMSFIQPDGTTITVVLHGDEHMHWFSTLDGVILSRQGNAFYIASNADGIQPTDILAHNADKRTFAEISAIGRQDKQAIFSYIDAERERNIRKVSIENRNPAYFTHMGSPKVLVLLAEFSDRKFIVDDPQQTFNQFFNAEGIENHVDYGHSENRNYCSVREYFNICSDGQYTPEFVITKPIPVGTMSTYGGSNPNSANDENVTQLIKDAMVQIEGQYNYSDFDNDGDGRVDLVYIVYSGYCQNNGGPANSIWAKTSSCNVTVGDTKLLWYSCASELNLYESYFTNKGVEPYVSGIGVTCHELSHALGLPDIYPTSAGAIADNQEMEYWDLMDGGEYVSNGYRPKDYTAWEREVMGWKSIEELTAQKAELSLTPLLDGGKAYKFCNPDNHEEYFVMENIQNKGLNKSFPGHGMILYHVKYPYDYVTMGGNPNNINGKPGMAIVPADGACLSSYLDYTAAEYRDSHKGDAFPGTSNITRLDANMHLPNYMWYDGWPAVYNHLEDITEDTASGIVTLTYFSGHEVTSITLDKTEAELSVGETLQLNATVLPEDAADASVTWATSNAKVATVNDNGEVTAIAPGEAIITATTNDGTSLQAECNITVLEPSAISSISNATVFEVYNILGQKLGNYSNQEFDAKASAGMINRGLYIINGKKVIVK